MYRSYESKYPYYKLLKSEILCFPEDTVHLVVDSGFFGLLYTEKEYYKYDDAFL